MADVDCSVGAGSVLGADSSEDEARYDLVLRVSKRVLTNGRASAECQ